MPATLIQKYANFLQCSHDSELHIEIFLRIPFYIVIALIIIFYSLFCLWHTSMHEKIFAETFKVKLFFIFLKYKNMNSG